jgi:hypothetical protein
LVKYDGRPGLKLSTDKKTLVDEKQVFRIKEGEKLAGDMIALRDERLEGEPILKPLVLTRFVNHTQLTLFATMSRIFPQEYFSLIFPPNLELTKMKEFYFFAHLAFFLR